MSSRLSLDRFVDGALKSNDALSGIIDVVQVIREGRLLLEHHRLQPLTVLQRPRPMCCPPTVSQQKFAQPMSRP